MKSLERCAQRGSKYAVLRRKGGHGRKPSRTGGTNRDRWTKTGGKMGGIRASGTGKIDS